MSIDENYDYKAIFDVNTLYKLTEGHWRLLKHERGAPFGSLKTSPPATCKILKLTHIIALFTSYILPSGQDSTRQ